MSMTKIVANDKRFSNGLSKELSYEPVCVCPICKSKILPVKMYSMLYDVPPSDTCLCVLNYCNGCNSPFISIYVMVDDSEFCEPVAKLVSSEPNRFFPQSFDDKIVQISPMFDKIYNQSLAAETSGLDEIAGLGYRKSLEFLIKDYAIYRYSGESESIKSKPLMQCIKSYISNKSILVLAERSAWIGNDEAHYIRKHEDRDISDMKSFIQAIVYYIGMSLITEDAASMSSKN